MVSSGRKWKGFVKNDEIHGKTARFPLYFCAILLYNEAVFYDRGGVCMGEVIAVVSGKGGTGKTSVCAGLATALAECGESVLCIDCDIGLRNLDISLGISQMDALSFMDICRGEYTLEQAAVHPEYPGLRFLTAPMNCQPEHIDPGVFGELLRQARKTCSYIFLDAPAGIDAGFQLAARYADRILLVCGADPASVAFATLSLAVANNADVVIIDTAGRLHNKIGLMNELTKIKNVMQKVVADAPHEVLLVLDGSTGQNAFEQAKQFTKATEVTAMAITKLDGTAKGGVVIGISDQFKIPVKYIGLGEGIDHLQVFRRKEFVDSLFGETDK